MDFPHLSSTETSFSSNSRSMTAQAPASAAAWRGWNPVDLCRLMAMVDHSGGPEYLWGSPSISSEAEARSSDRGGNLVNNDELW